MRIELWTDGSGTFGGDAGGWAYILRAVDEDDFDPPIERFASGWVKDATNNRMEMMALLEGLRALRRPTHLHVFTDSEYVMNPFAKGWLERWVRKDWKGIKNTDIWQPILEASRGHRLTFTHVEGHSGVEFNEACDELAGQARRFALEAKKVDEADDSGESWDEALVLAGALA